MRVRFRFARGLPTWAWLRQALIDHFEEVDFRTVPVGADAFEQWSCHPRNSGLYYSFSFCRDGALAVDGIDLWRLDPVFHELAASKVAAREAAYLAPDRFAFIAVAVWEAEGVALFTPGNGEGPQFRIERGLLGCAPLAALVAELSSSMPRVTAEEWRDSDFVVEVEVSRHRLLGALELCAGVKWSAQDHYLEAELEACLDELKAWLQRRISANERVFMRLFAE